VNNFEHYAMIDESGEFEYWTYDKVTGEEWEQLCIKGCSEVKRY